MRAAGRGTRGRVAPGYRVRLRARVRARVRVRIRVRARVRVRSRVSVAESHEPTEALLVPAHLAQVLERREGLRVVLTTWIQV